MDGFLLLAFLFLVAGCVAVPIASRLGLGSVLGYLLAGIAISPFLEMLHVDVISIQHFAEFGVVMMLFLVGLELEPRMLWNMRSKLLGLGGLQVSVTALMTTAARKRAAIRCTPTPMERPSTPSQATPRARLATALPSMDTSE